MSRSIDIDAELKRTSDAQNAASHPATSVWVSANAGTGKTHVLTMRVLRLLLAGTKPERILCLTYTKAAASEMSKRVFADLARWVTLPAADLAAALTKLLSRPPNDDECARARTLFTASIETPGGFKVQTIHAFAERLLQRFPLEAGVTPGFAILDDLMARELRREAIDAVLADAAHNQKSPLGQALRIAVTHAADDRFDDILTDALSHRNWLETVVRLPKGTVPGVGPGLATAEALLRRHFAVRADMTTDALRETAAAVLSSDESCRLAALFEGGSKTDKKRAEDLRQIAAADASATKVHRLHDLLTDSKGAPRPSFATKKLAAENPDIETILSRAQAGFLPLWTELKGAELVEATMALTRLAGAVMQRYQDAKARRAALDFDDLIARTQGLLLARGSAEWVLFKLDNGLDHLLVDESQDTSPSQWQVVAALAEEFFAGSGTRDEPRTIFAVGDEKQSIYSFQGAAPEMFARMGERFADLATRSGATFRRIALNVSFRTTAPVLEAVDAVFADPVRTPGVPAGPDGIRHVAKRLGQSGRVEIWTTEKHNGRDSADPWAPLDETSSTAPDLRLADRIAQTIKGWLDDKTLLASAGRPIRPGDILILVRKRRPFAGPMVAALKSHAIPVAGADRLALTQHIAVQDLLKLGSFLTLPEDDLALAEALKSPVFDFDDDDLLRIAHARKGTLWKALLDHAAAEPRYAAAAETLKRWRKAADFTPPYEFWASLLDRDGVRAKLIARLGPDAADPVDEFLNVALTYDDSAPASLTGFLHALTSEDREIKRDMEHTRDEVRIMTVHGAKGLEAPIVILPDTCASGANPNKGGRPMPLESVPVPGLPAAAAPLIWPVKGTSALDPVSQARADIDAREAEERNRLLYVAMTRPRDHLIVTGFEGRRGRAKGCWFDLICEALNVNPEAPGENGRLLVLESPQSAAADTPAPVVAGSDRATGWPAWALTEAPREKSLSIPLAPSRLAPYETDGDGDPLPDEPHADPLAEPPASRPSGSGGTGGDRFLRGTLTHALLEHLPAIAQKSRRTSGERFLESRAAHLPKKTRTNILKETLAILDDDRFAPLFATDSRAEVPIVAEIPNPSGRGPALKLTGQIDRLAVTDAGVLIVDYKTNRASPGALTGVSEVYLYQLAAYRLALAQIYPGRPVRAALLWTEGPQLMEIPGEVLDRYTGALWQLDPSRLDVQPPRS